MTFFNNLELKWKLISIVVIPILCLLYFSQSEVVRNSSIMSESDHLLQLSRFSVYSSSLVHELQKERGATAGFMGSKGQKFVKELPAQRKDTNTKREALLNFLESFEADIYGSEFKEKLDAVMTEAKKLDTNRNGVDSFNISSKVGVGFYTNLNSMFLELIGVLATYSSNAELTNMATAYTNFLNSKERAGIERAVITGVFAQDKFAVGGYDRFQSLVTIQNVYLDVFKSLASPEHLQFYDQTMKGEVIVETDRMRKAAVEHAATGGFGVDPTHWFKMQTEKINLLKEVENKLSKDLESLAMDYNDSAATALIYSVVMMALAICITLFVVYFVQRKITIPVKMAVKVADSIAEGNLDNTIRSESSDESGQLLDSLGKMQSNLDSMQSKIKHQMEDERKQARENSRIRQALDNTSANVMVLNTKLEIIYLNSMAKKLFSLREKDLKTELSSFSASRILNSNIDSLISDSAYRKKLLTNLTDVYTVEKTIGGRIFKIIANPVADENAQRLGTVIEWVDLTEHRNAEKRIQDVIQAAAAGQLDTRLDTEGFNGFMKTLADGLNQVLDAIVQPLSVAANYVDRISKGDIPEKITENYQGDFVKIKNNLNTCIDAINLLISDSNELADAAVRGDLSTRAKADKHQGDFRKIVEGVNNTLDALITPLSTAANYVDRISKGDIPDKITEQYQGDFNLLKNNLNTCIDAINLLVMDANGLADSAVRGDLSSRADIARHQGEFKRVVEGVNKTLDAVITPLSVAADYVNRISRGDIPEPIVTQYQGDFNEIKDNLNTCIQAINLLVSDANSLAAASVAGDLSTRADEARHMGDFRKIVEGVNSTLEAIVAPIDECKDVMEALAEGDLTKKITGDFKGEFAVLRDAVNTSVNNLYSLVYKIDTTAGNISEGAKEITTGVNDLSQRTEQQATSLEKTASSLEELTSTVQQNEASAITASELANNTSSKAELGGAVVNNAVQAMGEINTSSKKIADIIGVIDEIAFQTNLLALNAAVEAARAGEQGRGFAVVAAEVRNLAQRSSVAAKDIKDLINDSVIKVEEGSRLVNESGATLLEIVESVKEVATIISEIAVASKEQSSGIKLVNTAVSKMDEMTQQNAALVEQASAASESMDVQACDLTNLMTSFNTK